MLKFSFWFLFAEKQQLFSRRLQPLRLEAEMAAHGQIHWWQLVYCQSDTSWGKINALALFINTGSHSRLNWINVATQNHVNLNQIEFKVLKGARWWQLTNQDPKNTLYSQQFAGTSMMPVDSGQWFPKSLWFYILMKTMSSFARSQIGMTFENWDFLDMLKETELLSRILMTLIWYRAKLQLNAVICFLL